MCSISMEIPDRSLAASQIPAESAAEELRMLAAVKLYELGRLSSGAAAEFAGIPKPVFLQRLGDYGVATFRQTEAELSEEIANASCVVQAKFSGSEVIPLEARRVSEGCRQPSLTRRATATIAPEN